MTILPTQQNIMEVFSSNKPYHIDFYQRDYQWRSEDMERLLDDLFYRFGLEYKPELDPTPENISKFDWYYLNAYVTNDYEGKTFIVDGQQRLTSLTLIMIKLYHQALQFNVDQANLIREQIIGYSLHGKTYWMGQDGRKSVLEDLFINQRQTKDSHSNNISHANLYRNYEVSSRKLDRFLDTAHKFESFVIYFLTRVMLVRTHIEASKDVPMVFEVINDRGVRLLPYEVLKGKLLGQIEKDDIEPYHDLWQEHVHRLQRIDETQVDTFFRFYFRSNYVDTRNDYRAFDGDYHKTIYEDKWNQLIKLKQNPTGVKQFVKNELTYFADLYARLLEDSKRENSQISKYLYFNDLNDQDRQFLLILSACDTNDPQELQKIDLVARLLDQHFTLLQLTGTYDNNRFTESLIALNRNIRNQTPENIQDIYKQQILEDISAGLGIEIQNPFEWAYFKDASLRNMGNRFLKYFLARIEHFIAIQTGQAATSYNELVLKTGYKWGYHIEHILSHNDENLAHFGGDDELFLTERNRLGGLLLLVGIDNQASQNELYKNKLKTYSHSLLWNRTLTRNFYHKNKNFEEMSKQLGLRFEPIDVFDRDALEKRQRLLFDVTRYIWQIPEEIYSGGSKNV